MSFHAPFLEALQHAPLQQHASFGAALSRLGRPPLRVFLGAERGEVQVLRRQFGPLSVGLVSRANLRAEDLGRLRKKTGCRIIVVNAETPGDHPGLLLRAGAHVAELALNVGPVELKAQMAQKWRNRLSRSMRSGLTTTNTALPADPGHWLLQTDLAQQRARRYRNYPPAFTAAFAAANPGQSRLFEAKVNGTPVAAMLFLCHGQVASYHIGWNGTDGRSVSAHHLLLWRAMIELPRRGISRIDLGSVDTEAAPGLARFKLGSGAECKALGGTWAAFA